MLARMIVGGLLCAGLAAGLAACAKNEDESSCSLTSNTTATSTTNTYGCSLLTRDTSSCQASRTAQGLSGFWLNFSCRVTLTKSGSTVSVSSDGQPDYLSSYFDSSNACYEAFSAAGRSANPNTLGEQSFVMTVGYTPTTGGNTAMNMGVVGLAANGVAIFSNAAAAPDNIYDEVATFDKCEGHPAGTIYHYHIEPPSLSNTDSSFIGVMRDGHPIYGRKDANGSTPTLDAQGGHTGTTPDSTAAIYHYHVNLQTDGTDSAYFVTSGFYEGTQGTCSGC